MPEDPGIARLVEQQLRNWEIARQQRLAQEKDKQRRAVKEFVTISRPVGTGGAEVARGLAERLGWPLFDREILSHMAQNDQVRAQIYAHMEERDITWIDALLSWVLHGEARRDDYVRRLTETILALARQGPGIFLGRGADLILPQDHGLRVRLEAPLDQRIHRYAELNKVDLRVARMQVPRIDHERAAFFRKHFHREADDNSRFDLVLNLGRMSRSEAVELILAALKTRGLIR